MLEQHVPGVHGDGEDSLQTILRLKRQIEHLRKSTITIYHHEEVLKMEAQRLQAAHAEIERLMRQNQQLRQDLKLFRCSKCVCCLYATQRGVDSPCRDCQTILSAKEDLWVYKEPL